MTDRICVFSSDRRFRFTLWRQTGALWVKSSTAFVQFIGLNPSTADEHRDDPTIRRCVDFARRWGFAWLCMTNIFAFRSTDPQHMKAQVDPIGPGNDSWLERTAKEAEIVVAAWGKHGSHLARGERVVRLIRTSKLVCLAKNKDGSPIHPLYVKRSIEPIPFA